MVEVRKRRRIAGRLAAFVIGSIGAILLAEVAVRMGSYFTAASRRRAWESIGTVPEQARQDAFLGHFVRPVANSRRLYEFVPDVDVTFIGVPVRINEHGFRGPAYAPGPPDQGTIRIVGIGDSIMFGWGVHDEDSFLRQLEADLSRRHPDHRWEVINTAVPGYNTVIEVETLADRGLDFAPDLVILDLVGNDLDLPNFLPHEPDYWTLDTSFLLELVVSFTRDWDTQAYRPLIGSPRADDGRPAGPDELDRVPERYRDLVGVDAFDAALTRLRTLADRHGFEVVVSTMWGVDRSLRPLIESRGFAIAEGLGGVVAYLREHGYAGYESSPLALGPADPHPTPLGHRIEADAILDCLERSGILTRLLERRPR